MYLLNSNLIDSVFRTGINYYPQGFLGECKYVVKGKEISYNTIDKIQISSDSDRGTLIKKVLVKKILLKKILIKKIKKY